MSTIRKAIETAVENAIDDCQRTVEGFALPDADAIDECRDVFIRKLAKQIEKPLLEIAENIRKLELTHKRNIGLVFTGDLTAWHRIQEWALALLTPQGAEEKR